MATKDYLASLNLEEGDKLDYGIKGMKWGVRRSPAQLAKAKPEDADIAVNRKTGEVRKVEDGKIVAPDHLSRGASESAAARYSRLQQAAKAGKGKEMSDDDLKFFNARTEALAKVNKLNETQPGWLSQTAKKVIQKTAQMQMQEISNAVANKYISGPIIDNIGKHVSKEAAKNAAKAAT